MAIKNSCENTVSNQKADDLKYYIQLSLIKQVGEQRQTLTDVICWKIPKLSNIPWLSMKVILDSLKSTKFTLSHFKPQT